MKFQDISGSFLKEIILEAENKNYPPQVYESDTQVRIQGVLSGIIRKYN